MKNSVYTVKHTPEGDVEVWLDNGAIFRYSVSWHFPRRCFFPVPPEPRLSLVSGEKGAGTGETRARSVAREAVANRRRRSA